MIDTGKARARLDGFAGGDVVRVRVSWLRAALSEIEAARAAGPVKAAAPISARCAN